MANDQHIARTYWNAIFRRPWLVATVPLLVVAVAVVGALRVPDRYSATVTMRVATPGAISGEAVRGDALDYLDRLQNTYAALAKSRPLRTSLMRQLELREPPGVSVSPKPASELMDITVTTSSPRLAQEGASGAASLLIDMVRELERERYAALESSLTTSIRNLGVELARAREERDSLAKTPNLTDAAKVQLRQLETDIDIKSATLSEQQASYEQVRGLLLGRGDVLSVAVPASRPSSPAGPSLPLIAGVALVIGLVGAVGLAALFERLRTRVATKEEVEQVAQSPVVAELYVSNGHHEPLISEEDPIADGYRRLRTDLLISADHMVLKSILVTSPDDGEHAGWVVTNLAVSLARSGQRVLLVDGDVSSPTLHEVFNLNDDVGLADVLLDEALVDTAPQLTVVSNLNLVTAGGSARKATDAVTPGRVAKAIAGFESLFEVVLVKAPALLAPADSLSFAAAVSGALLVVTRGVTKSSEIEQCCNQLRDNAALIVGVVLTDSPPKRLM